MEIKKELLRSIPKVDEVLAQPQVKKAMEEGRSQVTDGVRQVLDGLREQILRGEEPDPGRGDPGGAAAGGGKQPHEPAAGDQRHRYCVAHQPGQSGDVP